jgi:peptidoglycan/LPS O-acetylase OafA/YrhL
MPQLDSLRFFAVFAVLISHNWGEQNLPWLGGLSLGSLGVRLFFVLSGFLITGILLDCRSSADSAAESRLFLVRQFYVRRFLRIFPIYYLVIALALVFGLPPTRDIWPWLVTYTSNLYISLHQHWIGHVGHFWTLAVEEQFYIAWPWLVLYAPRKWLFPVSALTLVVGPLYRYHAITAYPQDIATGMFTSFTFTAACLDSLGVGTLLALLSSGELTKGKLQGYLDAIWLPLSAAAFAGVFALHYFQISTAPFLVVGDLLQAMIFGWLVYSASRGFKGSLGQVLELRPLVYLGKITYGIYIYHGVVPAVLVFLLARWGIQYRESGSLNFVVATTITIMLAALSWSLLEQPINRLKSSFQYSRGPIAAGTKAEGAGGFPS